MSSVEPLTVVFHTDCTITATEFKAKCADILDRLIVATACRLNVAVVTRDTKILGYDAMGQCVVAIECQSRVKARAP